MWHESAFGVPGGGWSHPASLRLPALRPGLARAESVFAREPRMRLVSPNLL